MPRSSAANIELPFGRRQVYGSLKICEQTANTTTNTTSNSNKGKNYTVSNRSSIPKRTPPGIVFIAQNVPWGSI